MRPIRTFDSYRFLLRAYPSAWRARQGDELFAVLADCAERDGRRRPTIGECVDLVLSGLEARADSAARLIPTRSRERAALLSMVSVTSLAIMILGLAEIPRAIVIASAGWSAHTPPVTLGLPVCLGWIAAFVVTSPDAPGCVELSRQY